MIENINDYKAKKYFKKHMKAFENWKEGNISTYWIDEDGNFCIIYDSGNWWHYKEVNGVISWW